MTSQYDVLVISGMRIRSHSVWSIHDSYAFRASRKDAVFFSKFQETLKKRYPYPEVMPSFMNRQTELAFLNRKRKDGLQWPWHYFQIAAWALYLFLGITAFGFIVPLLPCSWQSTGYGILGTLFLAHLAFHVFTISIDASRVDPNVAVSTKEAEKTIPKRMHFHIMPVTFYQEKTRYCLVCRKHVFNYDHHSQIFNTCLGGRNFWFYMNCIATAFLGTACLAIMSLFLFSMYRHQPWEKMDLSNSWLIIFPKASTEIQSVVILIISFTDGVLSLLTASVLGYRICFHLYLLYRGMTTQEYYERLALKKSLHHLKSRDLEAAHPSRDVNHFPIFSVSRKSHLYLCDSAMQTEQTLIKNTTTQTNDGRFLEETGSQTENEARHSNPSLTSLVERLQIPFRLARKAM